MLESHRVDVLTDKSFRDLLTLVKSNQVSLPYLGSTFHFSTQLSNRLLSADWFIFLKKTISVQKTDWKVEL